MRAIWLGLLLVLATVVGCGDYRPAPLAPTPQQTATPTPPAASTPPLVMEKAEAGVGAKGRDYGPGLVTTPISQYFLAKEKTVFDIQVPKAMQLYKATTGHAPQSLEEFVKVMKENQIKLPELPEGHKYVYDPQAEQLQVIHPKK